VQLVWFKFEIAEVCVCVCVCVVLPSSVFQTIEDEELSYTLTMSAYTDANFNFMIDQDTDIELNQKVWVEIKTEDLDENTVAVVTDSCWLTTDVDPTSSPSHDLVVGG